MESKTKHSDSQIVQSHHSYVISIIITINIIIIMNEYDKMSSNPGTARTLYNKKDVFRVKHDTENKQSRAESSVAVGVKKFLTETIHTSTANCS